MAKELRTFGHGAAVYPLDETVAADVPLIAQTDPGLWAMLRFLAATLKYHLGAAFREYAGRNGLSTSQQVVRTTASVEPVPALYSDRTQFPFFTVWRKSETFVRHSLVYDKSVGELEFAYVLPALMPEVQAKLAPLLRGVVRVIARSLRVGSHPEYEGGAEVLALAGVMSARLVSARYERYERMTGAAGNGGEQFFRAVVGAIELVERDTAVKGAFEPYTGADIGIDLADDPNRVLSDVVNVKTNNP